MGVSPFARAALALLALSAAALALAATDAPGAAASPPPQNGGGGGTVRRTIPLPGWRALTICAPVSVLITDAPDGKSFDAVVSGPTAAVEALALNPTRQSLQVETRGTAGFGLPTPLTLELRLPPGILSYVERVHAPGDTVVTATWNPWQAEVSSSAQSGVIVAGGMGLSPGASAKVGLAGPGPAVLSGPASRWEIFAGAPGGVVHVTGPTGYVAVKVDGGAAVTVVPAASNVTVAGWVGSAPGTSLALGGGVGDCQAHADAWVPPPGSAPGAMPPPACGSGSASPPGVAPAWPCGVEVTGEWTCGGGGRGPVPSVTPGSCSAGAGEREMRAAGGGGPAPPAVVAVEASAAPAPVVEAVAPQPAATAAGSVATQTAEG